MDEEQLEQRIELINQAIMSVSRGEYSVQLELSPEHNPIDAHAMGINMMIDELRYNFEIGQENIKIKLLNKKLLESQRKAEESDRLKSAFLANMSHEIRTPMNGILGFAELLKNQELSGDQQQKYLRIIEKSGVRMLNIINDIVDISKIESGLMTVEIVQSNINKQIEDLYLFFKPECESKGICLSMKNSLPTIQSVIQTDQEKVYAILTNLIKNAIKYSLKGDIEFGYINKPYELEFFVRDQGIGIPRERQQAIFERFIQADLANRNAFQGAGLGLAISKSYVEMLGGKIWVESKEEIGSTFYFTLPYKTVQNKWATDEDVTLGIAYNDSNSEALGLKILIAEDDESSELLVAIGIEQYGKEILMARNGLEAVEVCRNNPDIDLILMDIQMPVMSGYKATKKIREFNSEVIIIALTACGLSGDREEAIEAGCNDYISKPIKIHDLLVLIDKYFRK